RRRHASRDHPRRAGGVWRRVPHRHAGVPRRRRRRRPSSTFPVAEPMTALDWSVVLVYFELIGALTWWTLSRSRDAAEDYFRGGRRLGWCVVGASVFASNLRSDHLVGLARSGATSGVALAHYELHVWCLLVLGWVFVPFYMRSRVYTMPEFLESRF